MSGAEQTMTHYRTLSAIVDNTDRLEGVYKSDLEFGDRLVVTTRNSTYVIHVFEEGLYTVTGGWFDLHGLSPTNIAINGCTWGGRAIKEDLLAAMAQSVINGEIEQAADIARQSLGQGIDPLEAIEGGYASGIREVGERFERGEFFLPHLAMGAEAMKSAMAVLEPELARRQTERRTLGRVVIGTVAGDIHEIGKTLVSTMLAANGFTVTDLGANVAAEHFVEAVRDKNAHILGLSALLTTTMLAQREVIAALEAAGLREQVKVMVGGAPVTQAWAEEIGADGYAEDAIGAVREARELLGVD